MAHAAYNFDTLLFANRLKEAGCNDKLAETHAREQAEIITMLVDHQLITKKDVKDIEKSLHHLALDVAGIRHEIQRVETGLNTKIENIETRLDAKIDAVEARLITKIDSVETRLNAKIDAAQTELNNKIDTLGMKLTIRLSGMMVVILSIFHALAHFA